MEVVVMNPSLSVGQKIGLVISFIVAAIIFYAIYKLGAPRR